MNVLKATFRISTPMFLGDAEQKPSSLRAPSVKGALRFWWRALLWPEILAVANGQQSAALRELHAREAGLFGTAADENSKHGQGQFLLTTTSSQRTVSFIPREGHQYLLGQGLYSFREGLLRVPLQAETFELQLLFKPGVQDTDRKSVVAAVLLLGLLGGLGSRSRKGFGSTSIQSLEGCEDLGEHFKVPANPAELEATLKALLGKLPEGLPPFTAFSTQSRIDLALKGSDALGLLDKAGHEMQMYRSFGQNGMVGREPAERNFVGDHDLVQAASQRRMGQLPERAVFGLPHNCFFSSTGQNVEIIPQEKERSRRASPLFLHIHHFPDGGVAAIYSLLPAVFLPPGDRVAIRGAGGHPPLTASGGTWKVEWGRLSEYLNRFPDRQTLIG